MGGWGWRVKEAGMGLGPLSHLEDQQVFMNPKGMSMLRMLGRNLFLLLMAWATIFMAAS